MFDSPTQSNSGVNFAPVEALRKFRSDADAYKESSLISFIRSIFGDLKLRNYQERREINESARLMAALRSGKMMIMQDPIYGHLAALKTLPHKSRSEKHVHPLAQVNSTQLTSIWSLSRPKTVPRDFGNTNSSKIVQATMEQIIEHYDASQMDELFHQRESLSAMDYGTIAIRTQYDQRLNQIRQIAPITEDRTQTVHEGYGYCRECGDEGTPDKFQADGEKAPPRCKNCGSYSVSDIVQPQVITAPQIVGQREIIQGDIAIDQVPIAALNWDMRHLIQHSGWVYQQTEVPTNYVRSLIGAEVYDEDPTFDDGLRIMNQTGTRGGSVKGWGRENLQGNYEYRPNVTVMHELWLKPEMLAGMKISSDEQTVAGVELEEGQYYTDVFPEGMAVIGFNDMRVIAGVFNEKCRIKSSVYHIQSNSGIGKGTTDAIEVSEHLSIAHSAAIAIIKRFAAGGGWQYDSDLLTKTQAKELLKPGGLVGVKMRGSNYTQIGQALQQVQTGSLDNGNLNMIAQLSNMLNIVFQTTDFTSGVADTRVDINTLGGQQLLQAQNQQRSAAPLRMKAYSRAEVFQDVLELFRKHIIFPKFIGSRDKFSLSKGKMIKGADLPEKIYCDSVPDSELPVNRLTRRDNLERMLTQTGQSGINFFELKNADPRFASWLAGEFHVDMPIFNYTEILIVCQNRLDAVLELAAQEEQIQQMAGLANDPRMVAESVIDQLLPPLTPTEDNLVIKAQVLAEYLDDELAAQWSPLQQQAVQALIWRHYRSDRDFRGGIMALEQETQLGLQARANQQQMNFAQQQQQLANQDQAQQAAGQLIGQSLADEEQFARDEEKADNQHQRDMEAMKQSKKQEKK